MPPSAACAGRHQIKFMHNSLVPAVRATAAPVVTAAVLINDRRGSDSGLSLFWSAAGIYMLFIGMLLDGVVSTIIITPSIIIHRITSSGDKNH